MKIFKVEVKLNDGQIKIHQETNMSKTELIGVIELIKIEVFDKLKIDSIVEKQELVEIDDTIDSNGELLLDWANRLHDEKKMSNRLHRLLTHPNYFPNRTINDLTKDYFLRYRGCGITNWIEFVKLRGY